MKFPKNFFFLPVIFCILPAVLGGCASFKESCRGFIGVSTKILEDKRPEALKKSFNLGFQDCYAAVKERLEDEECYIYAEDSAKNLIAIYVSEEDTTPVGIFFVPESASSTLVEVSSPSIYAKETVAKMIFSPPEETEGAKGEKKNEKKKQQKKLINKAID